MAPTNRPNPIADYFNLPEIVSGYVLPPHFSIVVPPGEDRTNLVQNPSFETDTNNWTAVFSVIAKSTSFQWAGAYSLRSIPASVGGGQFYGGTTPITTSSNKVYAASISVYTPIGGVEFDFYVADTSGNRIAGRRFRATGRWQREWFVYKEASGASRRLYITLQSSAALNKFFYIDAVQFELCSDDKVYPTTYIDGDQKGFTPGEYPTPYFWGGTPHASISVRVAQTRSGGRVLNLGDLGFTLSSYSGLALPVPQHVSQPFGALDGSVFQKSSKKARTFALTGRVTGRSPTLLDIAMSDLLQDFDIDTQGQQMPMLIKYQPMNAEGEFTGPELNIIATYDSGGEGQRNNHHAEALTLNFTQYAPTITGHSEGTVLDPQDTLANAVAAVRKKTDGTWTALSTGFAGGSTTINAICRAPNGRMYLGGTFTSAGPIGSDYAVAFDPVTGTFVQLNNNTVFNNVVRTIAASSDGFIYLGGYFDNANGIANADGIVKYDPVTDSFAALGTGINMALLVDSGVFTLAFNPSTGILYVGGRFDAAGGVGAADLIASYNPATNTWAALGTGGPVAAGNWVNKILVRGDYVYAAGTFSSMGGVANSQRFARFKISTAAWEGLGAGAGSDITDMAFGPDGLLYLTMFNPVPTTIGGIATGPIARWNEVTYESVGSSESFEWGLNSLIFLPNGSMVFGGYKDPTTGFSVNGLSYPDALGVWDGGGFTPMDIDLPSSQVDAFGLDNYGSLYVGFSWNATTCSIPGIVSVTTSGTAKAYPVIIISDVTATTRLYSITNITTNRRVFFNYTLQVGERAVLFFDPMIQSFVSTFQGDIAKLITIGSSEADFFLVRGANNISVLANTTSLSITIYWTQSFLGVADAVGAL